jgi:hypothetical protein
VTVVLDVRAFVGYAVAAFLLAAVGIALAVRCSTLRRRLRHHRADARAVEVQLEMLRRPRPVRPTSPAPPSKPYRWDRAPAPRGHTSPCDDTNVDADPALRRFDRDMAAATSQIRRLP